MTLMQAVDFLIKEFELLALPDYQNVNQNGQFLIFDGLNKLTDRTDEASFSIVLAANSLNKDDTGLMELIWRIRQKVFSLRAEDPHLISLERVKTAFIGGALYCAKCEIKITLYN